MRLLPTSLCWLALQVGGAVPFATAQEIPSDSAIQAILRERLAPTPTMGIVVGVLDRNGRRVVAHGSSGTTRPLDGKSVFEIGSITKVFTASLLALMVMSGEAALEDPVASYLPAGVTVPSRNGVSITLLHLATQSSGLPRLPSNFSPRDAGNPYADYTVEQMYEFLSEYTLTRDPGAQYEYSNLGMGLLGHALAARAGVSYEQLLSDRLLAPLGMSDTRISLTPDLRARLAIGHNQGGEPVPNWDIPALAGAGALRSTVDDMLTFLAANLREDVTEVSPALMLTHGERIQTGQPGMTVGLGWHRRTTSTGGVTIWHNGGTGGYRTFAGFDPDRQVAVVVLHNSARSADDIGFHILDPRFPLAAPPVVHTEVAVDSTVLEDYVGVYELAPEFTLTVTREGARLFVQATGQPRFPVFPESETEFFYKVVDAQISFERDAAGVVRGLVLHQGGRDLPARKR
ncbi:MAG: serine hydrolase [Gemmatimonadales bacterium]